jgi:hypothetical protein
LFKTFNLGIVLGIVAAAVLVYFYPAVNQHREPSMITVQPNGGNVELFNIRLPGDRIMAGVSGLPVTTPPGLEWPEHDFLTSVQAELFKVRNNNGVVIGTASRLSSSSGQLAPFVEWTVHLPARGSMFLKMSTDPSADGFRAGILKAGTREFLTRKGTVIERFVSAADDPESDDVGRIELHANLVGLTEVPE